MYIPIDRVPQSVLNNVLNHFVRDVIAFDEKPRSNRARIEYRDWCCELLTLLIQQEKSDAIVEALAIILETTDDKHLRKALEDNLMRATAARQFFYEKQRVLKRNRKNKEREDNEGN